MQLVEPGAARRIEVARARAACAGLAQRVGIRSGVDMTLGILVLGQQSPANRHRIRQDRLVPDMQRNARSAQHPLDALVALGAVIRGETYHFELVSNEAGAALTRVGLDFDIPVANGVLTCDTDEQAEARMAEKGRDCARCAVEMANLQKAFYD